MIHLGSNLCTERPVYDHGHLVLGYKLNRKVGKETQSAKVLNNVNQPICTLNKVDFCALFRYIALGSDSRG